MGREGLVEVAPIVAPHCVLLNSSLVEQHVFGFEHAALEIGLHHHERAFFEGGFFQDEFVQVALLYPSRLLLAPHSLELVYLVAFVVVHEAVEEAQHCSGPHAISFLVANFE